MGRRFIANVKGVGVEKLIREYYPSTSASEVTGGTWNEKVPTLDDTHYLWTRLKVTLTDGSVEYTDPLREGMFGEEIANLEDLVTEISNKLKTIAPGDVVDIMHGGTGEKTAAGARQVINFIGKNPTSSLDDDTVDFWIRKGTGLFFVDKLGQLTNQPAQYGMVLNLVETNNVLQLWLGQSSLGTFCRRSGDKVSGWYSSGWIEGLDKSNTVKTLKSNLTWASGKVTVPDSEKYTVFQICLEGQGTTILAMRHTLGSKTYIRGASGYENDTPTDFTYHVGIEASGEEWDLIGCSYMYHEAGGIHSVRTACKITKIVGVM